MGVQEWNRQYVTATKLHKFLDSFLEMYPIAHQASRQHGLRGGCGEELGNDPPHGVQAVVTLGDLEETYLTENWPPYMVKNYVNGAGPLLLLMACAWCTLPSRILLSWRHVKARPSCLA